MLYVGQSANVERRIAEHASSRDIDFSQVFVDRCEPDRLLELEAAAIRRYKPRFNEQLSATL